MQRAGAEKFRQLLCWLAIIITAMSSFYGRRNRQQAIMNSSQSLSARRQLDFNQRHGSGTRRTTSGYHEYVMRRYFFCCAIIATDKINYTVYIRLNVRILNRRSTASGSEVQDHLG